MELTAENVQRCINECLFRNGENHTDHVVGEGAILKFGFHPGRIAKNKANIASMLRDLPIEFHEKTGGGMSYLAACMTAQNIQWGEHRNIDELLCLGTASGLVEFCAPREFWSAMPGGMPYFVVKDLSEIYLEHD